MAMARRGGESDQEWQLGYASSIKSTFLALLHGCRRDAGQEAVHGRT